MTATASSTAIITVEAPTREEPVRIFARRFPGWSLKRVGKRFDEYLALGHLDVRRDELTDQWRVLLSEKRTRQ